MGKKVSKLDNNFSIKCNPSATQIHVKWKQKRENSKKFPKNEDGTDLRRLPLQSWPSISDVFTKVAFLVSALHQVGISFNTRRIWSPYYGQIYLAILTNIFGNWEKYMKNFGQTLSYLMFNKSAFQVSAFLLVFSGFDYSIIQIYFAMRNLNKRIL